MKDIFKKILIGGVSLTIIIIITISAVMIIKNKSIKAEEDTENITNEVVQDENVIEVELQEEQGDARMESDDTTEDLIQEENVEEQVAIEPEKQTVQTETVKQQTSQSVKSQSQSTTQNNKVSETPSKTAEIEEQKVNNDNTSNSEVNTSKTNVETNKNTNNNSTTTNNNTSDTTNNKKVETFKYNSEMTQKMINVIKSNESEYMKQYGYNVVVDESIIANTNQFTYTESRVKNAIIYKFGTIRVYARDYYVDGQYMWTECFIL